MSEIRVVRDECCTGVSEIWVKEVPSVFFHLFFVHFIGERLVSLVFFVVCRLCLFVCLFIVLECGKFCVLFLSSLFFFSFVFFSSHFFRDHYILWCGITTEVLEYYVSEGRCFIIQLFCF